LQTSPGAAALVDQASEAASPLRTRLVWLMLFRAVVVAAILISTLAVALGAGRDIFQPGAVLTYGAAAATYAMMLIGAIALTRSSDRGVIVIAHTQLLWDVFLATALSAGGGGIESAFAFFYFLAVLLAAALLGGRGAQIVAVESAVCYSGLLFAESSGWLVRYGSHPSTLSELMTPFLTNVLGMFLIGILAGYLTEQLRQTSESLTEVRESLFRLEELYGAVLGSLPSGVLTVDDDGSVLYVNHAGASILGGTPVSLAGKELARVAPTLPLDSSADDGQRERFEVAVGLPAGGERVLGGSVAALTGLEGLAGQVVVFQDLTELRRLQRDVARADRLATVGRFAAGLAHEIRNPLAAMIGCLELLSNDLLEGGDQQSESARMLDIVHREAQRLSSLVSEFLTYARPRPPEREPLRLDELVDEVSETARAGVEDVAIEIVHDASVEAEVDPDQIRQVVWNLVINALSAAALDDGAARDEPAGEAPREANVRVTVTGDADEAVLVVEDSGPGIPEEQRARVFEPFYTTRPDGTGLGLATCYQVVDAHGGIVLVGQSELGGARFEVRLPLRAHHAAGSASQSSDTLPAVH
jgi:two-component system sensor histidine kinase PilS (NtrC family)